MAPHATPQGNSTAEIENDLDQTRRRTPRKARPFTPSTTTPDDDHTTDDGRLTPIYSGRATYAILFAAQQARATQREMLVLTGLMNLSLKWGRLDLEFSHPYLAKWTGLDPDRHSPYLRGLADKGLITYTPGRMYRGSDGVMHCAWSQITLHLPEGWDAPDPATDEPIIDRARSIEDFVSRDRVTPSRVDGEAPPAQTEGHLPPSREVEEVEQSTGRASTGRTHSPVLAENREQGGRSEQQAEPPLVTSTEERKPLPGTSRAEDRDYATAHATPTFDAEDVDVLLRADGTNVRISPDLGDMGAADTVDVFLGALSDTQRGRLLRFQDVREELVEAAGVWSLGRAGKTDATSLLMLLGHWYAFRGGRNAQYADSTFRSGVKRLLAHMNGRGWTWEKAVSSLSPAQALVLGMRVGVGHRIEVDADRVEVEAMRGLVG